MDIIKIVVQHKNLTNLIQYSNDNKNMTRKRIKNKR